MLVVELIIVLLAIFLGARLGGIGIGFAGGLGVLVLAAIGVKPGNIPFDVISIIMAVIAAISAMQVAGGLDYLVHQTEKLLRRNPKYITILAPIVTYFLTIFAGTGNISLATLPVIAEVAKEQGVKPCRPLSTAVVSAQIAITASPISAAVVYMSSVMEGHGISYLHLLSVVIPSTLLAVLVMSFLVTMLFNSKLSDDPIYRKRLEEGLVELRGEKQIEIKSGAKTSVWLFLLGVVGVVIYAIINSPSMGLVEKPLMNTTNAILIIMLSVATLTTVICKVDTDNILNSSTFKAGMSACICILGVAWLGDTFVSNNIDWIKDTAGEVIQGHPWLLAVIFFFASAFFCPCLCGGGCSLFSSFGSCRLFSADDNQHCPFTAEKNVTAAPCYFQVIVFVVGYLEVTHLQHLQQIILPVTCGDVSSGSERFQFRICFFCDFSRWVSPQNVYQESDAYLLVGAGNGT